jgi:putative transposase
MARLPRLTIAGFPHHIVQRGLAGQPIFEGDVDRRFYLDTLGAAARASHVAIHAYALLPGEAHLVATPVDAQGIGRMIQRLARQYAAYFNRSHLRNGPLWEGRFRCSVVEPKRYLLACMQCVESLPVRARLVGSAQDFPWSSAPHHCGLVRQPTITEHEAYWNLGNTPFERESSYSRLVQQGTGAALEALLLESALKGWAVGFENVDVSARRRLRPLPRGRRPAA